MALSADQRALLELLLQKRQGYDDIASLLDVSEAEVRSRARWALAALGDADPDRNVAMTDWLLGQADPIGRADAARHVREDPEDHRLAATLIAKLRELAPEADLPKLPPEPGSARFGRRAVADRTAATKRAAPAGSEPAAAAPAGRSRTSLSSRQTRMFVALGSAAVILIAIVLAVTGAFGGGDEESTQASATTTAAGETTTGDSEIQTIRLRPSGGGDAQGTATFGIAGGQQAYVDLDVSSLEPAPNGEAYILWLLVSEDQGHPLTPFQAGEGGSYSERIPIDSFLTSLAARTRFVDISLSPSKPLLKQVGAAVEAGTPVIDYTGESIMRGKVPVAPGGGSAG